MRHPVSTHGRFEGHGAAMQVWLVRGSGEPGSPQDADPSAREYANGVRMIAAARASAGVDVGGPCVGVTGVIGEAGQGASQAVVTGPSEGDAALLAGFEGERGDAGLGGELRLAWEALAHFECQAQRLCFCGHTHVPMLWHQSTGGTLTCTRGEGRLVLPSEGKILVNVGSVGQPRDQQPTACYVLHHTHRDEVEFRRVAYDVSAARRKIQRAGLPKESGDRLLIGR